MDEGFLCKDNEIDIFSVFAYEFELSQYNEILVDARMKSADADEIFGFASDEIKSTHPLSRRISTNEVGFHHRRRFHPPKRMDLIEKMTGQNLSFFLAGAKGLGCIFACGKDKGSPPSSWRRQRSSALHL